MRTRMMGLAAVVLAAVPAWAAELKLTSDQACYQLNEEIVVTIELSGATTEIVGGQYWLEYDPTKLAYTPGSGNPVGVAPWSVLIFTQHTAPVIFLSVGIPNNGTGAQSGPMAQLKFTAIAAGCGVQDAVKFKSPDGAPPTRLSDRYDNAIYPTKVNLAPITIDSTPPVITCTNITTTADPGECSAGFIETFDDPVALCPTNAPQCWQVDRKAPGVFTNAVLGGENVLHHGIRAADVEADCAHFNNTQGRKYPLDMPVGTILAVDVYIPANYATNLRDVGLWGVTYDSAPQIVGYPILNFASTNPSNGCDPTPQSPRFRYWTQDVDQNPSNGYQAGWVNMMPVTTFDVWYRLEIELTATSYIFRVKDAGGTVLASAVDLITWGAIRFGEVILNAYNFGADYDIYWDNLTVGPRGPIVTDNCGNDVNTALVGVRSDGLPLSDPYPVGTTTITWTATDCAGNTASCTQTITVTDDEGPVITCPANLNVTNDPGQCSATVGQLLTSGWTLVDDAAIVAGPPANGYVLQLRSLGANTPPWGSAEYVPPTPLTFSAVTALSADYSMVTGCFGGGSPRFALGLDTNTDTVVDGHVFVYWGTPPNYTDCPTPGQWFNTGNLITDGTQRFDLTQFGGPFYATHAQAVALVGTGVVKYVLIALDGSWMYDQVMLVDNIVLNASTFSFGPVATDNCGIASIVGVRSDAAALTDPYPVGTTTITWTVTDTAGHTATCLQTVNVTDNENPVITCPPNITQGTDPGQCTATVTITPATATDNCGIASIVGVRSDSQPLSAPYPVGTTTITWTATDTANHTATCSQTVTVSDAEPPAIVCPANGTIECDDITLWLGSATGGVLIAYNNNGPEVPTNQAFFRGQFSQTSPVGALFNFSPALGVTPGYGPNHLFQVIPDQFGFDFTLPAPTYNGSNPPLTYFTAVDNVNGTCAGATTVGPVAWAISGYTPTIPNAGACPVNSLFRSNALDPNAVALTQWNLTSNPPIYTADIAGRVVTDGLVHWYNPLFPDTPLANNGFSPTFTFAGRLTYDSTGDPGNDGDFYAGTIDFFAQLLVQVNGAATATDNCTPASQIVITYTDVFTPGGCGNTGTIARTWKAQDQSGNISTCVQTITVVDVTPPTFTSVPCNKTVNADAGQCSAIVTFPAAAASDNCDLSPTVTAVRSDGQPLTAPYPIGTTTITWTAADCSGNTATATTTVTVNPINVLVVDLELRGVTSGPFDRCITFELDPGNVIVKQVVTFTADAGGSRADNVTVFVPIPCPSFTGFNCIRARDDLHTLWAAQTPGEGFGIVGNQYVADFTNDNGPDNRLVVGNLNGDEWIDVLDFGIYVVRFGLAQPVNLTCAYTLYHPDFDGSGLVDTVDFTVIQTYFLFTDDTGCGAKHLGGRGPVTRISVEALKAQGLAELIPADLNGDGWLDTLDMEAFAAGARPARPGDLNADGVVNFADVDAFVLALEGEAAYLAVYPQGRWLNGDLNGDGAVTLEDSDLLVQALQNP